MEVNHKVNEATQSYYTPRCELKHPRNIIQHNINKLIHRLEERLDLKSECILVSAMVHLLQE